MVAELLANPLTLKNVKEATNKVYICYEREIHMTRHEQALKILKEGTVIPATPLALTDDRKLNEKGLKLLMNYYLDSNVGGIATAVHTTQFEIRETEVNLFEPVLKLVSE